MRGHPGFPTPNSKNPERVPQTPPIRKTGLRRALRRACIAILFAFAATILLGFASFAILNRLFPFPLDRLDRRPVSSLVTDRDGRELMKSVGPDFQWRRPIQLAELSPWAVQATIAVEDERFRAHGGVDGIAVARAALQNARAGRVVSGASTLTMQVCRMLDGRPRGWRAKFIEAFRALQLERIKSKDQILELYLNMAPYGGNICGLEAASRVYFGKRSADLSLGEAALLAGLPQSPTRYRPDLHPEAARARRAMVLNRMLATGSIHEKRFASALAEPIDARRERKTLGSPWLAAHAGWLAMERRPGGGRTTIDAAIQADAERLAAEHARALPAGSDVAIVIIEIATGDIVAMVGSADLADPRDGQVNGALARRSPGSALKPFIYAAGFETGRLAPDSVVYDGQIERAGWAPANFAMAFTGEVTVEKALQSSLNIPAIRVAEAAGLSRCVGLIEAAGARLPPDAATRGGLALVVGAVEVTLLDLTNAYATLGRGGLRRPARLFADDPTSEARALDANVCAAIDDILSSKRRRPRGVDQLDARHVPWFMWKTGTSSGRRDAWAIGHNRRYAIGVWAGKFSGQGHPDFVGGRAAEPLLARLFMLPRLESPDEPPPPKPWTVARPLLARGPCLGPLRIVTPSEGAVFGAVAGEAILRPRASRIEKDAAISWFLNGEALAAASADRLALAPGAYELRCANASGESAAVRFQVRR